MRLVTADWIFAPGEGFFRDAVLVLQDDGTIHELQVAPDRSTQEKTEKYQGTICPGFVNAHCHLELSHMLGLVKPGNGFVQFATELIPQRNRMSPAEIGAKCIAADAAMFANGINGVGDISNQTDSFTIKSVSNIKYHTFIELLGLNPSVARKNFEDGQRLKMECPPERSLSPHAPYSVSAELLRLIEREEEHEAGVITIHNQESRAESEFSESGTGDMLDLYKAFGIDISWYKPSGKNSLAKILLNLLGRTI